MSDVILFGEPMALFAAMEEGALEEATTFKRMLAGAEVNVSVGLTRLGFDVLYATRLGTDPFGDYIEKKLKEEGIGTSVVRDCYHPTGFQWKNHVLKGDPSTYYLRKNSAASCLTEEDVNKIDFTGAKLLHITGILPALSLSSRNAVYRMIEKARENHMIVSFDPNLRPSLWESKSSMIRVINDLASKSDIVLPGTAEGKILMGSDDPEKIGRFYQEAGAKIVIVKLGSEGAYGIRQQEDGTVEQGYFKGYPARKVVDTVGAGDGFAVGVLSAFLEGGCLEQMCDRGNIIGSMQVMVESDNENLPTREEIERFKKEFVQQ